MYLDLAAILNSSEVTPFIQSIFEQLHYMKSFDFNFANYSCLIKRVQTNHFNVTLEQNYGLALFSSKEVKRVEKTEENFESLQEVLDFLEPKIPVGEPNLVVHEKSKNKCTLQ